MLLRSLAVWGVIMVAEVLHGVARGLWLVPRVGEVRARQLGVAIGSVIILGLALAFAPWLNVTHPRTLFRFGMLWVLLTLGFEVALGRGDDGAPARVAVTEVQLGELRLGLCGAVASQGLPPLAMIGLGIQPLGHDRQPQFRGIVEVANREGGIVQLLA